MEMRITNSYLLKHTVSPLSQEKKYKSAGRAVSRANHSLITKFNIFQKEHAEKILSENFTAKQIAEWGIRIITIETQSPKL